VGFLGIVASWGGDMRERKGCVELEGTAVGSVGDI